MPGLPVAWANMIYMISFSLSKKRLYPLWSIFANKTAALQRLVVL